MNTKKQQAQKLFKCVDHRPWALPKENWTYYQEWNEAIFLHAKIPLDVLRKWVPQQLIIDTFEGHCYVSLVAFTMEKIQPKYLPALSFISDFHEINLRTYVTLGDKSGVYFLSIEAQKSLSVWVAKSLSGLPYEKSNIVRTQKYYQSVNPTKEKKLEIDFEIKNLITEKKPFDYWVTERYCLYVIKGKYLYRYEIHHKEWELYNISSSMVQLSYTLGNYNLDEHMIESMHYSPGVEVISWSKNKV